MFFVWIIILLIMSAWFSGTEIALFSMTPGSVKSMVIAKKKNAKLLEKLLKNKKRLLVVILLGNNLVNITAASMMSLWVEQRFENGALGIATGVMTLLILIFGEMFPKAFAQNHAEKFALFFAPIIYFLEIIFYPIVILLEKLLRLITGNKTKNIVSEQELKAFSRLAVEHGILKFKEHEMIMNIINFEEKTAKEVMTPRYKMSVINEDAEIDKIAHFISQEGFSRYPVFHNQEDNIIGYVHIIDIMRVLNSDNREDAIKKYVEPIITVNEDTKIDKILKKMIKRRVHIALVYRNKEQLIGMLTLEDMLEEIVGEIRDENDDE